MKHKLYVTGDAGAPDAIKDQNGAVVLGLCKVCGQAEVDLTPECPGPTDNVPFPKRMERFVAFCEGRTEALDRADAQAVLQATRDMSQRVFRQLMALNTMQQSLPLIHKALSQGLTLIDAFNAKVTEIDVKKDAN